MSLLNKEERLEILCPYGIIIVPKKECLAVFNRLYMPLGVTKRRLHTAPGFCPDETRLAWYLDVSETKKITTDVLPVKLKNIAGKPENVHVEVSDHHPFVGCAKIYLWLYEDDAMPIKNKSCYECYMQKLDLLSEYLHHDFNVYANPIKPGFKLH